MYVYIIFSCFLSVATCQNKDYKTDYSYKLPMIITTNNHSSYVDCDVSPPDCDTSPVDKKKSY